MNLHAVRTDLVLETSWDFAQADICGIKGWSLVGLESQLEVDFVGFHLQKQLESLRNFARTERLSMSEYNLFGTAYIGKS